MTVDDDEDGYEPSHIGEDEGHDKDPESAREEEDQGDDEDDVRRSGDKLDGDVDVEVGPREDDHHDDDDLDIEGIDGEVRLAKRGTLKHEAKTLQHFSD